MNAGPVTAILLAGGTGKRMGADVPKQFLDLHGGPMLLHPLLALEASAAVSAVVVVLPEVRPASVDEAVALPKVCSVAIGGPTRQASLGEGLTCVPEESEVVLVHDAARPLLTVELVERVIEGLDGSCDGAICAIPVEDAIKLVSSLDGSVIDSKSRIGLWRAQTPQAFERSCLEDSLARADAALLQCEDCSEMAVRAGYRVRVVPGDPRNVKVARPEDLWLCEALLSRGSGVLSPGDPPPAPGSQGPGTGSSASMTAQLGPISPAAP